LKENTDKIFFHLNVKKKSNRKTTLITLAKIFTTDPFLVNPQESVIDSRTWAIKRKRTKKYAIHIKKIFWPVKMIVYRFELRIGIRKTLAITPDIKIKVQ
jgi:hypothetical protein